jgi:predicted amidohydrolase YtcJ
MTLSENPDSILHNARVYTFSPREPIVDALAISQNRIIAAGSDVEILHLANKRTEIFNLDGRTVLPGLTDAHIHLEQYALLIHQVDCEVEGLEACLNRVRDRTLNSESGEWILGHGWNQNVWDRYGNAKDLDAVSPRNPVYLTAKSLHAGWANSAALDLAHISTTTPDPAGGEIQRDASGAPTGILFENAMKLISDFIPAPTQDRLESMIVDAQKSLWRFGITSIHDFDSWLCYLALQSLHHRGELGLRVCKNVRYEDLEYAIDAGVCTGSGDLWVMIGNIKVFTDGALGTQTAALLEPYEGLTDNHGILVTDSEDLLAKGIDAARHGMGMAIHALGDRANREALDAIEGLRRYERDHRLPPQRHRMEHLQLLHPDDLQRPSQLSVVASMQPIHAISDMATAERYWGKRNRYAYAWKRQLDAGATLAFGSDAPVETPNPFIGLYAAITRKRLDHYPGPEGWYPEERLTLQEALLAYTQGPAYAAGMEGKLGALQAGSLADLIVLECDPYQMEPSSLAAVLPVGTMVDGAWRFRAI